MPIERKAWGCKWGCCRRVTTKRKSMESHEARCFYNPATKSCATCKELIPVEKGHFEPEYPPERTFCEAGHDLTERLHTGCADWKPMEK